MEKLSALSNDQLAQLSSALKCSSKNFAVFANKIGKNGSNYLATILPLT